MWHVHPSLQLIDLLMSVWTERINTVLIFREALLPTASWRGGAEPVERLFVRKQLLPCVGSSCCCWDTLVASRPVLVWVTGEAGFHRCFESLPPGEVTLDILPFAVQTWVSAQILLQEELKHSREQALISFLKNKQFTLKKKTWVNKVKDVSVTLYMTPMYIMDYKHTQGCYKLCLQCYNYSYEGKALY